MFSKKNSNTAGSKSLTVIAEGVRIEGKLFSRGSTRIDGDFYGEIMTEKELVIGRPGKVSAIIKINNAIIAGDFKGNMIASGEVEIASTGKFAGNLTQKDALLTIEKGGLFKGESLISDDPELYTFPDPQEVDTKNPLERRNEGPPREPERRATRRGRSKKIEPEEKGPAASEEETG